MTDSAWKNWCKSTCAISCEIKSTKQSYVSELIAKLIIMADNLAGNSSLIVSLSNDQKISKNKNLLSELKNLTEKSKLRQDERFQESNYWQRMRRPKMQVQKRQLSQNSFAVPFFWNNELTQAFHSDCSFILLKRRSFLSELTTIKRNVVTRQLN